MKTILRFDYAREQVLGKDRFKAFRVYTEQVGLLNIPHQMIF
jgi:hypothetical protein